MGIKKKSQDSSSIDLKTSVSLFITRLLLTILRIWKCICKWNYLQENQRHTMIYASLMTCFVINQY